MLLLFLILICFTAYTVLFYHLVLFIACLYVTGRPCCKSLCLDNIIIIIIINEAKCVALWRAYNVTDILRGGVRRQNSRSLGRRYRRIHWWSDRSTAKHMGSDHAHGTATEDHINGRRASASPANSKTRNSSGDEIPAVFCYPSCV